MAVLDANDFYENGNLGGGGKLTKALREVNAGGTTLILALMTALNARLTAQGAGAQATAAATLVTYFGTPANVDLTIEPYG